MVTAAFGPVADGFREPQKAAEMPGALDGEIQQAGL
jgi:hypothetical protein